jgi:anti-anti-sigma factor
VRGFRAQQFVEYSGSTSSTLRGQETVVQTLIHPASSHDPYVLLEISGELDLDTQDGFEEVVSGHLGSGSVVLDMSQVEFLAIASLRSLLSCQSAAEAGAHHLVYAETPDQARRLLELSGVAGQLEMCDSLAAAGEAAQAR